MPDYNETLYELMKVLAPYRWKVRKTPQGFPTQLEFIMGYQEDCTPFRRLPAAAMAFLNLCKVVAGQSYVFPMRILARYRSRFILPLRRPCPFPVRTHFVNISTILKEYHDRQQ